jgi:putative ABC transport system permease protein
MFLSYLRIAIRNAIRQKTYTLVNVLGLTIGIAVSILISFWILDEISYEKYFDKADQIHRIDLFTDVPQTRTPHPMAQAMVRDFPEVENATSLTPVFGPNMSKPTFAIEYEEIRFDEKNVFAADTGFFDVFSFEFIMGDPNTAFEVPHAIIITREISEKYFGKENPIGKMLTVNNVSEFMVTGVLENLPPNIHFHFDFLISYVFMKQIDSSEWFTWADYGHYNYVVIANGTNVRELQDKIPEWILQYIDYNEGSKQDLLDGNIWFQLTPIRDIHLKSNIRWELETNGNISYVYIFMATALLVLFIACINYMNLATARFNSRSNEVAIRKTAGASRRNLIYQFLLESFLITVVSVALAGFLVELLVGPLSVFTGKDYTFYFSQTGIIITAMILLAVVIGLITGSYPAFYLSAFSPMKMLRNKFQSRASVASIRVVLVIFQFTISIFLIISTLTIFSQLKYMGKKDLGFDRENVLIIPVNYNVVQSRLEQIKESLLMYPEIEQVSAVSNIPGGRINNNPLKSDEHPESVQTSEISVDFDFIETLGLNLVEGRNFSKGFGADSVGKFILNETAVRELELKSPIHQEVIWNDDDGQIRGEIIGVIGDYHFESLHKQIAPLILMVKPAEYNYLMVRFNPRRFSETLTNIEMVWKKFDDLFTFEYSFMTDQFNEQYRNESKMGTIYWMMAILALVIASLGLYGLSAFMIEQKTQEIGLRKVHGATSSGILRKLLIIFSKWVLLAFVIAAPLAYWGMTYWLRDFSYQVNLSIWIFLVSVLSAEIVAILAVTYQAIRASRMKPVDSLKYD